MADHMLHFYEHTTLFPTVVQAGEVQRTSEQHATHEVSPVRLCPTFIDTVRKEFRKVGSPSFGRGSIGRSHVVFNIEDCNVF